MSGIYERLYQSSGIDKVELHIYIRDFINSLYEMYVINTLEVRFVTRLEEIFIDLKRAVPLGLILNELITNCLKYAFPEHRKGEIAVEILSKDGNIRVSVSDNGIGLPDGVDPLTATSMGFFLVQMDLTINSSKDRGTEVSLTFKL
jgi:two-component sensor histidine kinase